MTIVPTIPIDIVVERVSLRFTETNVSDATVPVYVTCTGGTVHGESQGSFPRSRIEPPPPKDEPWHAAPCGQFAPIWRAIW